MRVSLRFPNQLFEDASRLDADRHLLVEHPRYFSDFDYHAKKLVLHRASMKAYAQGRDLEYVEHAEADKELEQAFAEADKVVLFDPVDHKLRGELEELAEDNDTELNLLETPLFVNSMEWNQEYFEDNDYFQSPFYQEMRKRFDIMVDEDGKPEGGKWSFDPENRKKLPEDVELPEAETYNNRHVEEARKYVRKEFDHTRGVLGEQGDDWYYPVTHDQAERAMQGFFEERFDRFGPYQDALDDRVKFGFHSVLSSSTNTGLLTPMQVVQGALGYREENEVRMNSLEGFIRQILGWREYIRALYELEGEEMRSTNFFDCQNELPKEFYTAETGLPPVDTSVKNANQNAYCHHIERLMVLGNVMLLLEIDPDEVTRWFTEMFVDAYDWVMVPNVYGMSQYAWPEMMTKPYISSSNYIGKMSHYDGGEWEDSWDGLYWNFIKQHRDKIDDIQRMSFMTSTLDRMGDDTVEEHIENAEEFKQGLNLS